MKIFRFVVLFLSMLFIGYLALKIYRQEQAKSLLKADLIELSNVKYGLFNVDQWKDKISEIVAVKVSSFKIDTENRDVLEHKISVFLTKVVDELESDARKNNEKESILGFDYKNFVADVAGVYDQLHKNIPKISKQMLDYVDQKENKEKIKQYILKQLDDYAAKTFSKMDYSNYNRILTKYQAQNAKECGKKLQNKIDSAKQEIRILLALLFMFILISFALLLWQKSFNQWMYLQYVIIAFVLLLLGLLLPMIDIDARISNLSFNLLGQPIQFNNQVLYFKSKSILEVVRLMFVQDDLKVMGVGLLILIFSVLFPIMKLVALVFYSFNKRIRSYKLIDYFVFKIGKWSMADVMVIAIFMAYIGFTSIISSQLDQLGHISKQLEVITSNQSELQSGFYIFTSFVVFSLFISFKLKQNFNKV